MTINCERLYGIFRKEGFTFFSGVPDSTFKDWMKYLADPANADRVRNVIAVNECEATAICAGYHLATGKTGVVYMQNSGLGKTVNPLTSLCDPDVYSIPALLMIGWRGEPGKKDEPQHRKMGRITTDLLKTLEIPFDVLPEDEKDIEDAITKARASITERNAPYAIIIRKGLIDEYEPSGKGGVVPRERPANNLPEYDVQDATMTREDAIKLVTGQLEESDVVVSTTGKTSRELFEYREAEKQGHSRDFLTVGSMGCSVSIAFGIALGLEEIGKQRGVFVFDGDGAVLMQQGATATIGYYGPSRLKHVVFDNSSYDSTGGQPSVSPNVDLCKAVLANGYNAATAVYSGEQLSDAIDKLKQQEGPAMLVVKVRKGARKDLGRPTTTPIENKGSFMKNLE